MNLGYRRNAFTLLIILAAIAIMPRAGGAASVRLRGIEPDAESMALFGMSTAAAPAASLTAGHRTSGRPSVDRDTRERYG